ncbi:hypothetical protein HYZ64_03515 [Candidatus Berkelbacteria bacterium]|nr:hypothetical protein [Candidatus Berkelbacteria bacterium]
MGFQKEWEKTKLAHEKYRNSGLAIMAAVLTLSFGILWNRTDSEVVVAGFLITIGFAILHQLFHYLGSKNEARSTYHRAMAFTLTKKSFYELLGEKDTEFNYFKKANKWFDRSDKALVVTVVFFLLSLLLYFVYDVLLLY